MPTGEFTTMKGVNVLSDTTILPPGALHNLAVRG